MTQRLYTPDEVAEIVGLSAFTVRQAIRDGELPAAKLRGRWRISPEDLDAWITGGRAAQARGANARGVLPAPRQAAVRPAGGYRQLARDRRNAS